MSTLRSLLSVKSYVDEYVPPELWFPPDIPYIGHIHLYREEKAWEKDAAGEISLWVF